MTLRSEVICEDMENSQRATADSRRWRVPAWLVFIAAFWLTVDFLTLPKQSGFKQAVMHAWNAIFPTARSHIHRGSVEAIVHRDAAGITLDFDLQTLDQDSRIGNIYVLPHRWTFGCWAPTREAYRPEVFIFQDRPMTVGEIAQVRTAVASHMDSLGMGDFAQWVREGRRVVTRPLRWGHARNAVALICAMIIALAIARYLIGTGQTAIGIRRLMRGRCPNCAYDLRAAIGPRCPECGWNEMTHRQR